MKVQLLNILVAFDNLPFVSFSVLGWVGSEFVFLVLSKSIKQASKRARKARGFIFLSICPLVDLRLEERMDFFFGEGKHGWILMD